MKSLLLFVFTLNHSNHSPLLWWSCLFISLFTCEFSLLICLQCDQTRRYSNCGGDKCSYKNYPKYLATFWATLKISWLLYEELKGNILASFSSESGHTVANPDSLSRYDFSCNLTPASSQRVVGKDGLKSVELKFRIWQKFGQKLAKNSSNEQVFHCDKWPNIAKKSSYLFRLALNV